MAKMDSRIFPTDPKEEEVEVASAQYRVYLEAKRQLVLASFYDFCVEVLNIQNLAPMHEELCNFVQDNQTKKRLILLPRGHLKSTIVTVGYSLWKIAQNPKIRILIANATAPMAQSFLRQIKNHLQRNPSFIELFGDYSATAEKWSDDAIRLVSDSAYESKEDTVIAFGIGGNLVSQHYDLILFDDLVNRDNIRTPDRIADVSTFYKDAQDLVDDPIKTEQIMIGTRWHESDLYGSILDKHNLESKKWAIMQREVVYGGYEIIKNPDGTYVLEGGTPQWEFKFTRQAINDLLNSKSGGDNVSDFSAQYLNDPVPASNATFKHPWLYYELDDLRGQDLNNFLTLDPSFYDPRTSKQEGDNAVFMVISVNAQNFWFIRDIARGKFSPDELINLLFQFDKVWHPKAIGVESTAWQRVIGYYARDKMRQENHFMPITELVHSGVNAKSKAERIQGLEPRYATGTIFHSRNVRHITTLEMELRRFPRAKTDDVADALASMLEIAYPPKRRVSRDEDNDVCVNYPA
jgi:hypothetical protein